MERQSIAFWGSNPLFDGVMARLSFPPLVKDERGVSGRRRGGGGVANIVIMDDLDLLYCVLCRNGFRAWILGSCRCD